MNDLEYLKLALDASKKSPDPSRKTGCLITTPGYVYVSGWNTFPKGVTPRLGRPEKYTFIEHAERNAIYGAAKNGIPLEGGTIYLTWFPCADCARAIVCSGITRLVGYEPDWKEERYGFNEARTILEEGGVTITFVLKDVWPNEELR